MPAKAPMYLKNAGGNKGTKKLREILSTDMISAPLGDFRHTAHVGQDSSDVFGDTSFIPDQDYLTNLSKNQSETSRCEIDGNGSANKSSGDSTPQKSSGDSSAIQSALSLPHLESTDDKGSDTPASSETLQKVYSKSQDDVSMTQSESESPSTIETEPQSIEGPPKPKRVLSKMSRGGPKESVSSEAETYSDSGPASPNRAGADIVDPGDDWKFELDMGPSLVDEIMGMIALNRPSQ